MENHHGVFAKGKLGENKHYRIDSTDLSPYLYHLHILAVT